MPTFFSTDADHPSPGDGSILEHSWCLLCSDGQGLELGCGLISGTGMGSLNTNVGARQTGFPPSEVSCWEKENRDEGVSESVRRADGPRGHL